MSVPTRTVRQLSTFHNANNNIIVSPRELHIIIYLLACLNTETLTTTHHCY